MIREGEQTLPMGLGEMPHELIFVVVTIVVIVGVLVVPLSWLLSYSQLPLSAFPLTTRIYGLERTVMDAHYDLDDTVRNT